MKQEDASKALENWHNVLLTGVAGSGKTHLLQSFTVWAREEEKNVAVTASTGLAAANINGSTIHNWSGIGARKKDELKDPGTIKRIATHMGKRYREAIESTDILIIDEISMLHDYQLDAIEKIVGLVRSDEAPFGGLQVVLCGDFFQLPPIGDNWNFITEAEAYFIGDFKVCYLEEVIRQGRNDKLTDILNAIRMNNFEDSHRALLNDRIKVPLQATAVTRLCNTNDIATEINQNELNQLPGTAQLYQWQTSGNEEDLLELKRTCKHKVAENLHLKEGAVVIFTKNDPNGRFVNGTIGVVDGFDEDWPNVILDYEMNDDGKRVPGESILRGIRPADFWSQDGNGKRLATIKQIPFILAWAITIHKSQGMTLDAAEIDIEGVWGKFGPGLGYVALSRVRRLQDISLVHEIPAIALQVNQTALEHEPKLIEQSKITYNSIVCEPKDPKGVEVIPTPAISDHIDGMDIHKAKKIVQTIANGTDPTTGEKFPPESHYNNPEIIRALFTILNSVKTPERPDEKSIEEKQISRTEKFKPKNAGLPWTEEQRKELKDLYNKGMKIEELAERFQRTHGAINSELLKRL